MYTALQLIKEELKNGRETFQGTVGDIKEDYLHADPGGKAFPIGATYAHLIFSEDVIVQSMIQGKTPLFQGEWKNKTGASEPMPPMDEKWSEANEKWSKSVSVDLQQLAKYSTAVFAATDSYISQLTEEDLEKEIDLGSWGKKTIAHLLSEFVIGHMNSITGEISALKGVQGAKGYPF